MYQCAAGVPSVSPGWSVFGYNTQADTVLSDTCSAGGSIGVYVFTEEHGGIVTENGHSGSQVGLQIDVPGSVPAVTIHSISAEVIGSPVTGDDAFLGFSSAGQSLPGGAELPYGGGSPYTASETWTLPQGARDFEAYVNCSTDDSSPSCDFADATDVPALTDITLSLEDNTPPKLASVSGPLVTAAASGASVMGSQPITFSGSDAESGVRSAALTLSPLNGGTTYVHTFNFSGECAYDSWNACPLDTDRQRLLGQHRRACKWRLRREPGGHGRRGQRDQRCARLGHGEQPERRGQLTRSAARPRRRSTRRFDRHRQPKRRRRQRGRSPAAWRARGHLSQLRQASPASLREASERSGLADRGRDPG